MNQSLFRRVWDRAKGRCEYCHMPASAYVSSFHVDHIVARQHGGESSLENLALACMHCNQRKGPNIAGMDPETIALTAWTRLDKFPASQVDVNRVRNFIEKLSRHFNPEGF